MFGSLDEPKKGVNLLESCRVKSLLTGLQAVGQVKKWKVQQIVFVGGTCGSIHVESFNRNMKALRVLESMLDPFARTS